MKIIFHAFNSGLLKEGRKLSRAKRYLGRFNSYSYRIYISMVCLVGSVCLVHAHTSRTVCSWSYISMNIVRAGM